MTYTRAQIMAEIARLTQAQMRAMERYAIQAARLEAGGTPNLRYTMDAVESLSLVDRIRAALDVEAKDHPDNVHRCAWGDFWIPGADPCKAQRTVRAHREILDAALHCLHWQEGDGACCRCGIPNWCSDGADAPGVTEPTGDEMCEHAVRFVRALAAIYFPESESTDDQPRHARN